MLITSSNQTWCCIQLLHLEIHQSAFTASDWNARAIADTGLTYKAIAPRPGTSAFASERFISDDEVHVAVVDTATNTIVERLTYLSKTTDAKTPEGASAYWKDAVNEYSGTIYAGAALGAGEVTTAGENPGSAAASYNATAASPLKLALIRTDNLGGALSGGTDDYAYTAGEITTAYDEFLDTEETTVDFVIMGGDGAANETDLQKQQAVAAIANSRKGLHCIHLSLDWHSGCNLWWYCTNSSTTTIKYY